MPQRTTHHLQNSESNGSQEVEAFLTTCVHPRKADIEALRAIIRAADPRIRESIKWNAPSFFVHDRFLTMRLQPHDRVQLVFHTGAKVKQIAPHITIDAPAGLVQWVAQDRAIVTFADAEAIATKAAVLQGVIRQWLDQL